MEAHFYRLPLVERRLDAQLHSSVRRTSSENAEETEMTLERIKGRTGTIFSTHALQ